MKKIISMLAVLCMLVTSIPMIVSADETTNEVTGFTAEDRVVYLNKDATSGDKMLLSNDASVSNKALWTKGSFDKRTASNGTEYLRFIPDEEVWVGADNPNTQPIKNKIYNQKKLTVETWISIDDIKKGTEAFVNLFTTTKSGYSSQNNGMWQLYVQDGKLKHKYNSDVFYEKDLTNFEGKFMHVVITRDVQESKIVLETIINGESCGTKEFTENISELLENPDGNMDGSTAFWIMAGYHTGNNDTKRMNFGGRLGEFNVYHNIMNASQANTIYNNSKAKYDFAPDIVEGFRKNEVFYENIQSASGAGGWESNWNVINNKNAWVELWRDGTTVRKYATGKNGKSFAYFDNDPAGSKGYFGEDNNSRGSKAAIRNNPETSVEAWISVDDILLGDTTNKKTIFYTGTNFTYSTTSVKWHVYVQDGKIKQAYDGNTLANEIDIKSLWGQFIHLVATRKVDEAASTITYDLYVNGQKATTHTRNVSDNSLITTPDGSNDGNSSSWWCGGIWQNNQVFIGKIAKFNVYNKVADQETVAALYNTDKDRYDIGVDKERVNEAELLRLNSVVSLNKSYTDTKYFFTIPGSDYLSQGTWPTNAPKWTTGTNANGENYSYLDLTSTANKFVGGDNTNNHGFLNYILNKDKMSVETWISVDDIMAGRVDSYRNIFYFANGWANDGSKGSWSLFVQNGQLKQTYENGKTACADIALGEYAGKFIHVVATRKIEKAEDGTINITYQTYFNGEAQTPVVVNVESVTSETVFFLGGAFQKENNSFVGKMTAFNMYNEILSSDWVGQVYNIEKDRYTVTTDEYASFKAAKALYLNKGTITSDNYMRIPGDAMPGGSKQWMWAEQMQALTTGVNKDGQNYTYYPFTANKNSFMCSDNYNTHTINKVISDRKNLTVEMWVSIDDIMDASEGHRQIFGTGAYDVGSGKWQLLVKNGKLVHSYKNEVIDEIDLANYKSEFVHIVLTRDVNADSISFNTYFNGEKQTGKDIAVTASVAAQPDGSVWTFGSGYYLAEAKRFVGKIADVVVYQDVMAPEMAATLYGETKDNYASEHTIKVVSVGFNNEDEEPISNLAALKASDILVTYQLDNVSTRYTKNAFIAVALYKGNKLVEIVSKDIQLEPGKSTTIDNNFITFTIPTNDDGTLDLDATSKMQVFVWSTDEGEEMKPYKTEENVTMELGYIAEDCL